MDADRAFETVRNGGASAHLRALALLVVGVLALRSAARAEGAAPPARLADTGLYADFAARTPAPGVLPYTPQYPLWTDGATKRRWIRLPAGAAIDASDPDAWVFPVGTRFWKEFSFGRPVETRYMERLADGTWLFATYRWSEDGRDAVLASERGERGVVEIRPGIRHDLPSRWDCKACHEGSPAGVLGFGALQLSPDRDPLAPHATAPEPGSVDLAALVARGLVVHLPAELVRHPPRVAAATPIERAALGYLHGNCSGCHNLRGPLAGLGLSLAVQMAPAHGDPDQAHATAVGRPSHFAPRGVAAVLRVRAGAPDESVLALRIASRDPLVQMPPLGTHLVDEEAVALIRAWISQARPVAPDPVRTARAQPISPEEMH